MQIEEILRHLTDISYIPVTYFDEEGKIFHYPDLPYLDKLLSKVPNELFQTDKKANCILVNELCFGIVKVGNSSSYTIFGPISTVPCDNRRAQWILKKYNLPTSEAGQLLNYLKNTPIYSLLKFANFIIFANYIVNRETLSISELLPKEYQIDIDQENTSIDVGQENDSETKVAIQNIDIFHNSYTYEKHLLSLIKYGKYNEMLDFLKHNTFRGNTGLLSSNIMRNWKNLIICSITLASRYAVEGGLDYETAMRLSDLYIQRVEMSSTIKDINQIHKNMLKTFTKLVAEKRINNSNAAISTKVLNFVEQHINEKIRVQDIAQALKVNRSYLSVQFKKETGMNINDFINKVKVEEAKRLMETSDRSITEIAALLSFSSQSYFQTVFKKFTGMTPKTYREATRSHSLLDKSDEHKFYA